MSSSQGKTSSGRKGLAQFLHLTQNEPPLTKELKLLTIEEMWKPVPKGFLQAEPKRAHSFSEEGKSKNLGNDLVRDGGSAAGNVPSTSKSCRLIPKTNAPQKNGIVKTVSFAEANQGELEAPKREDRKAVVASNSVVEVEAGMPVRKPLKILTRPWTILKEHKMNPLKLHESEGRAPREENVAKKVNTEVKSRPGVFRPPRRPPMGMQNVDRDYLDLLRTFAANRNDPLTESWED